jgi:hypothetical protein
MAFLRRLSLSAFRKRQNWPRNDKTELADNETERADKPNVNHSFIQAPSRAHAVRNRILAEMKIDPT